MAYQGPASTINETLAVALSSSAQRSFLHSLLAIVAIALLTSVLTLEPPAPKEPTIPTVLDKYGFSIQGITLGMSREAVESRMGPGTSESNGTVGYGKAWMETNPFDVERHVLKVGYEGNSVVSVTGRNLLRHGAPIKPRGREFVLDEFSLSHSPGVALREGTEAYESALMLSYPEAGVHVEYYSEKRMWFTIFAPSPGILTENR